MKEFTMGKERRLRFIDRALQEMEAIRLLEREPKEMLSAIEVLSHRLKGSAPTFGFERLGRLGAKLEDLIHRKSDASAVLALYRLLSMRLGRESDKLRGVHERAKPEVGNSNLSIAL